MSTAGIVLSYYARHVFFCTNRRDGRACCQDHDAEAARALAKERVRAAGLAGPGGVRVNTAGCLDRCAEGPVLVVYPEAVWYTYAGPADIEEIVDQHLIQGHPVERLKI